VGLEKGSIGVGLKTSRIAASAVLALTFAFSAFGAARLRLADTALGPISVNVGANGPTLIVNASNVGDSNLNLTATSDVTWLVPTVHDRTDCGLTGGNCPLSEADKTVLKHGVTIVGETNLPALVAADASALYARNVLDFLKLVLTKEGSFNVPMDDDIVAACLMTQAGEVRRPQ
jgi:hypothetical protein